MHVAVGLITEGVSESCDVEPVHGHAFAIGGRFEEAVEHGRFSDLIRPIVGEKLVEIWQGGGQAGEVECDSAEPGGPIGFRGMFGLGRFQFC